MVGCGSDVTRQIPRGRNLGHQLFPDCELACIIIQGTNDVLDLPITEGIGDFEAGTLEQRGEVVGASNLDIDFVELSNRWFS